MAEKASSKTLWTVALISIAVIVVVHFVSSWQKSTQASGAGPQPTSQDGGAGA